MYKTPITLRIGTDTDNSTYFKDPLRTLLFGFKTELIFLANFWEPTDYNGQNEKHWTKLVKNNFQN
jgi:hypothetical protein